MPPLCRCASTSMRRRATHLSLPSCQNLQTADLCPHPTPCETLHEPIQRRPSQTRALRQAPARLKQKQPGGLNSLDSMRARNSGGKGDDEDLSRSTLGRALPLLRLGRDPPPREIPHKLMSGRRGAIPRPEARGHLRTPVTPSKPLPPERSRNLIAHGRSSASPHPGRSLSKTHPRAHRHVTHPQNPNLAHGRIRPRPIPNPTGRPKAHPSSYWLALNLDPVPDSSSSPTQLRTSFPQGPTLVTRTAPVHPPSPTSLRHPPVPTTAQVSSHLHFIQSDQPPPVLHQAKSDSLYLFQQESPLPCNSFSPASPPRLNQIQA